MLDIIKAAGYRVFIRPQGSREVEYCFYTDGKRIGYAQWSDRPAVSSVHKANRQTGTGWAIDDEITPASLKAALSGPPPWASLRDRAASVSYTGIDQFLKSSAFNSELVEA